MSNNIILDEILKTINCYNRFEILVPMVKKIVFICFPYGAIVNNNIMIQIMVICIDVLLFVEDVWGGGSHGGMSNSSL